ncbi:MAG: DUF4982 domain-containing protein [Lachnospiraceae bacterium]|nr:DUF4982 domain-containing protein [Lachnospiraceae bacterium]
MRENVQGFNLDWQYHKGDVPFVNVEEGACDTWQYVNIPHCTRYITPDEFHAYEGVSWYRKVFTIPEAIRMSDGYASKKAFVQFDAIMQQAEVYLNGKKLAEHQGGYMGFVVELTNLNYDGENEILVRSDSNGSPDFAPTANKGIDFQYHGGMYRPVHLYVTDEVYITNELLEDEVAGGGIFVSNRNIDLKEHTAELSVRTHIRNSGAALFNGSLNVKLLAEDKICYEANGIEVKLEGNDAGYVEAFPKVTDAIFWELNNPYLYDVVVELLDNDGKLLDIRIIRYGIRSIRWQKDGLYINDKKQEALHGVNYHQDIFAVGNAMTKELIYEDVKLIKGAGLDFIRCSHYPHSPYFYEACDELGLVCLNSMTGWQVYVDSEAFIKNTLYELRQLVRRDRNHACVVAWESSINEAGFTHDWGQKAHDACHEEYPGCYTAAWKNGGDNAYPDIYLCAAQHGSKIYASQTDKPVIISEYGDWNFGGTKSTSRQERGNGDSAMLLHCNNLEESYADNARQMANGEVAADAYWDFTDYSPFSSEKTVIKCGLVDMYRIPKYGYYFYKSQNSEPMVFIANQWLNEQSPLDVRIYSNCEEVELFLNGESQGKAKPAKSNITYNSRQETGLKYENEREYSYDTLKYPPFFFKMDKFEPGTLTAVGYIGGKEIARYEVATPANVLDGGMTSDEDYHIVLERTSERQLEGDGTDQVMIYAKVMVAKKGPAKADEDSEMTMAPVNGLELKVDVTGAASLIGPDAVTTVGGIATFVIRSVRSGEGEAVITVGDAKMVIPVSDLSEELPKEPENFTWWEIPEEAKEILADVAREKKAYASSCAKDVHAWYGNSGNPGLWWQAATNAAGEWWMVDLEETYNIDSVNIVWPKAHAYRYVLEVSSTGGNDASEWKQLLDKSNNQKASINTNDIVSGTGRFVRITITGNVSDENEIRFNMFSVYGKKI